MSKTFRLRLAGRLLERVLAAARSEGITVQQFVTAAVELALARGSSR